MELHARDDGDVRIVQADADRIDAAVAIQFKDQMRLICEGARGRILLDLGRVDFIDSSGLGAIVAAMKQLGRGQALELARPTPAVAKVFRLTRMDTIFRIHDSVAAALKPDAA